MMSLSGFEEMRNSENNSVTSFVNSSSPKGQERNKQHFNAQPVLHKSVNCFLYFFLNHHLRQECIKPGLLKHNVYGKFRKCGYTGAMLGFAFSILLL